MGRDVELIHKELPFDWLGRTIAQSLFNFSLIMNNYGQKNLPKHIHMHILSGNVLSQVNKKELIEK
jgi:hypothetical protein